MAEARTKTAAKTGIRARRTRWTRWPSRSSPARACPRPRGAQPSSLDAIVALIDARGAVLAVAAGSPGEEHELLSKKEGVTTIDLRVSEAVVGQLRFRARDGRARAGHAATGDDAAGARGRAHARARAAPERRPSAASSTRCWTASMEDRRDLIARGKELGIDLENGGSVLAVRIHPLMPAEGDWQARALTIVGRGVRGVAPGTLAALRGEQIAVVVPSADDALSRRAAEAALRAVDDGMPGFAIVVGPQPHGRRPDGHAPRRGRGAAGLQRRRARRCRSPSRACCPSRTPAPTACCCPR